MVLLVFDDTKLNIAGSTNFLHSIAKWTNWFFKTDSYVRSWRKLKKVGHNTGLESYR